MMRRAAAGVAVLCAARLATAQAPALHFEYYDQAAKKTIRLGSTAVRVPSTNRISLTVVLEPRPAGSDREGGERLEVKAENQAPGYFDHRPPPNVTFKVRRMDTPPREVPFKVDSSGGGLDPQRLFLMVELDIIVDPALREARFRELAGRIVAAARQTGSQVAPGPDAADRLARTLETAGAVYIPPGEYEVTALYRSAGGALTSAPARFTVFEAEYPIAPRPAAK